MFARDAFVDDLSRIPTISLRSGDAIDSYMHEIAYERDLDEPTDQYIESYYHGIFHLDPQSWRHYLPYLMDYAIRHMSEAQQAIEVLLFSLRPPDRDPPRFASLSRDQEKAVSEFLHELAFNEQSTYMDAASTALEEWWIPGALFRT